MIRVPQTLAMPPNISHIIVVSQGPKLMGVAEQELAACVGGLEKSRHELEDAERALHRILRDTQGKEAEMRSTILQVPHTGICMQACRYMHTRMGACVLSDCRGEEKTGEEREKSEKRETETKCSYPTGTHCSYHLSFGQLALGHSTT